MTGYTLYYLCSWDNNSNPFIPVENIGPIHPALTKICLRAIKRYYNCAWVTSTNNAKDWMLCAFFYDKLAEKKGLYTHDSLSTGRVVADAVLMENWKK